VGLEKLDMNDENVIKAVGAFGGGIASSGSVCGTLLGAVAAVSLLYSRGKLTDRENPRMWAASHKLVREFDKLTESFGGKNCRDISHLDWSDRNAVKEYYTNPDSSSRKDCIQLVGDFSLILGKLLEKEIQRQEKS
jgi:C_GCAxxG_C_C family probable redox protein